MLSRCCARCPRRPTPASSAGAERAHEAVRELAERGTAAAIVVASGYGEIGAEGARATGAIAAAAGNMRLLGPNTIGLVNLADRIMLSAIERAGARRPAGGTHLRRLAERRHPRLAAVAGGRSRHRLCAARLDRQRGRPRRRRLHRVSARRRRNRRDRALPRRRARRSEFRDGGGTRPHECGKPLVVYKVGRSEFGARSAVSHTGRARRRGPHLRRAGSARSA